MTAAAAPVELEVVEEVVVEELWVVVLVSVLVAVAEPAELVSVVALVKVEVTAPVASEAFEASEEAAARSLLAIMEASEANCDSIEAEALLVSVEALAAHEVACTDASLARLDASLAHLLYCDAAAEVYVPTEEVKLSQPEVIELPMLLKSPPRSPAREVNSLPMSVPIFPRSLPMSPQMSSRRTWGASVIWG